MGQEKILHLHLYVHITYTSVDICLLGGHPQNYLLTRVCKPPKPLGDAAGKKGGSSWGQKAATWGGLSRAVWAAWPHVSLCPSLVWQSDSYRTQYRSGPAACGAGGPHPAPACCARGAARIWPAPGLHYGPRRAPPVPGCGAAAERGQCGMERSRLRSHEKLPSSAFWQDWGRGNGRARRASARSCSRFNELCFNERDRG